MEFQTGDLVVYMSNIENFQIQVKLQITDAPWYMANQVLHKDLEVQTV